MITSIEDTGLGIPEEKMSTLFSIFKNTVNNQFDKQKSNKTVTSGVGIGLTNAQILCEGLNGSIELKSRVNEGTRVTFTVEMNVTER